MSIGERITQLRKEKGFSQGQLAETMSVSRQAVSKWENDTTSPDTMKLIQLADLLEVDVEYLATGRKPVYAEPPILLNMVQKVDKVVERVVEKPVIRKVVRTRYLRNPVEYALSGLLGLIIGVLIGMAI